MDKRFLKGIAGLEHNHKLQTSTKEFGQCPACDDYHKSCLLLEQKTQINKAVKLIGKILTEQNANERVITLQTLKLWLEDIK